MQKKYLWLFIPAAFLIIYIVFMSLGSMAEGGRQGTLPVTAEEERAATMRVEFPEGQEEAVYYDNRLTSQTDPEWYVTARIICMKEGEHFHLLESRLRRWETFLEGRGTYLLLASGEQHVYLQQDPYVIYLDAGSTVEKEDLISIAEQLRLTEAEDRSNDRNISWDEFEAYMESAGYREGEEVFVQEFEKSDLGGIALPGEDLLVSLSDEQGEGSASLTIQSAEWRTEVESLFSAEDKQRLADCVDSDGTLLTDTVRFILTEEGTDKADVIVAEEDRSQRFLYLKVKCRNTSGRSLVHPALVGKIILLEEDEDYLMNYDRETPLAGDEWTYVTHTARAAQERGLCWWHLPGNESADGLILEEEEEVTMELGFLMDAVYLPYAYVSLDTVPLEPGRMNEKETLSGKYLLDVRVTE